MIYKRMYMGYGKNIRFKGNKEVLTSSAAKYEDKIFVYFETKNENLPIDEVCEGEMIKFPSGENFVRMTKVFQNFTSDEESGYVRKISKKQPTFRINYIKPDMEQSYIYYHTELQYSNPYNCDKFFYIFMYGNLAIIYNEEPREYVTWQENEGKRYVPQAKNWDELMNPHFLPHGNGDISWRHLENI